MKDNTAFGKYIRQEQEASPSAELTERIMANITASATGNRTNKWIQFSGIAASIVLALWLGWHMTCPEMQKDAFQNNVWNINDLQIENLTLYDTGNE